MCGLLGFFTLENSFVSNRRAFIEQGLFLDTLRGDDSTGLALFTKNKSVIYKKALPGYDFVNSRKFDKLLNRNLNSTSIFIGHNRAATRGSLVDENAHPFHHGDIILTHNGTLNYSGAASPTNFHSFDVDSEFIASLIDKEGPVAAIPKLKGAFALAWINTKDKSLNLVRNSDRPLHFAYIKSERTVVYASEEGMLRWIAERNDFEYDEDNKVWELNPGHLISFSLNYNSLKYSHKKVDFWKPPVSTNVSRLPYDGGHYGKHRIFSLFGLEKKVKEMGFSIGEEVIVMPNENQFHNWELICSVAKTNPDEVLGTIYGKKEIDYITRHGKNMLYSCILNRLANRDGKIEFILKDPKVIPAVEKKKGSNTLTLNKEEEEAEEAVRFPGPGGVLLSAKEIEGVLEQTKGCACCGDPISRDAFDKIAWTDTGEPACSHCFSDPEWSGFFPHGERDNKHVH